jgi:hypothetical protein
MKLSEHPHTKPSRNFLLCNETWSERKVAETAVNLLLYCIFFVYLTTLSLILQLRQFRWLLYSRPLFYAQIEFQKKWA